MNIEFLDRSNSAGEKLKQITNQKLSKLDKYFEGQANAKVCFKKEASSLTTEVMLEYANKLVRASASGDSFYDNLDVILPKLEGQIRKYRTRFDKHQKNNAFKQAQEFIGEQPKQASVVKEKKFKLTAMTLEEAVEELELLGHSFYVFLEAKSNTVQVLYVRNDGDYGLIEPEI